MNILEFLQAIILLDVLIFTVRLSFGASGSVVSAIRNALTEYGIPALTQRGKEIKRLRAEIKALRGEISKKDAAEGLLRARIKVLERERQHENHRA